MTVTDYFLSMKGICAIGPIFLWLERIVVLKIRWSMMDGLGTVAVLMVIVAASEQLKGETLNVASLFFGYTPLFAPPNCRPTAG